MDQDWKDELKNMDFRSKKKGRFSKLLKAKSKVGIDRKARKTYNAFDFRPRARDADLRRDQEEEQKREGQPDQTWQRRGAQNQEN